MVPDVIELFWRRQLAKGGPITTIAEWQDLFPAMRFELINRAQRASYND